MERCLPAGGKIKAYDYGKPAPVGVYARLKDMWAEYGRLPSALATVFLPAEAMTSAFICGIPNLVGTLVRSKGIPAGSIPSSLAPMAPVWQAGAKIRPYTSGMLIAVSVSRYWKGIAAAFVPSPSI